MASHIRHSVALITSDDPHNHAFGTGFVIHCDTRASYLLTCAHVIRDVGGVEKVKTASRTATVIASGKEIFADIAVLYVEGLLDRPPLRLQIEAQEGDPFLAYGCQSFGQHFLHRPIRGILGAEVELTERDQPRGVRAWDLSIIGDYDLQPGYSGSPVVLEKTGAVVAVTSHTLGQHKGLAISVSILKEVYPDAPAVLFDPPAAPNIASRPLKFSETAQRALQKRITSLLELYEKITDHLPLSALIGHRQVLEHRLQELEEEIQRAEAELQKLVVSEPL